MGKPAYEESVFINCPFDDEYRPLFEAIIFAVHDCGFIARCALEINDSSQIRAEKIFQLINDCRYGIHDISRTELDKEFNLPRFNMPLELGYFLGAKQFGNKKQKDKICLILDTDRFRYQKFCSDIAGQDIYAHNNDPRLLITKVRDWLAVSDIKIPSGSLMTKRYNEFEDDLPIYCRTFRKDRMELTFLDFRNLVIEWLKNNP